MKNLQAYYEIKFRCFVREICAGSLFLITAVCCLISILKEYFYKFSADSLYAYYGGIAVALLMIAGGILILYDAFNFDKAVFGRKSSEFEQFKEDMSYRRCEYASNFIVTDNLVIILTKRILSGCRMIRFKDMIACFEDPVYTSVYIPSEYKLIIFDRRFHKHIIVLNKDTYELGHNAKIRIEKACPWLYDDMESFDDLRITKKGRNEIMKFIRDHKTEGRKKISGKD